MPLAHRTAQTRNRMAFHPSTIIVSPSVTHVGGHNHAMHDVGCLGHALQLDLPRDWASLVLYRDVWRGVVSWC